MSALLAKRRLKNLLLFIPNMLLLCARLLTDSRVPATERALVAGAIVYAIVPFDLIPDMIPFVGQIDDVYLIALTLLRLMERTDPKLCGNIGRVVATWLNCRRGSACWQRNSYRQRIRRVLTSRVEVAPGKLEDLKEHSKATSGCAA